MADNRPNILIILADQHRFDCIGAFGNNQIKTPHLDALANDGVVFKNCFSTFPVCTPARYSLLTGLYAHQHLGLHNRSTLPHGISTFPRVLKNAGYATKAVGKMHFTPTYSEVGFDEMILSEQDGPGRYDDDYHRYLMERGLVDYVDMQDQVGAFRVKADEDYYESFGTAESNLEENDYSTTWIANHACDTLEYWSEGGNLLEVGFIKPHHPHDAPKPWSEMYNPAELKLLSGWTPECQLVDRKFSQGFFDWSEMDESAAKYMMAQYYASISQIDYHVGRMVEILKDRGIYDNTLIIYTSDHGDYLGFHHLGLKGNYMYDPVIKVPLIVKYPDSMNSGKVREDLISLVDLTVTIIDSAGCMVPQELWESAQPLEECERDAVFAEDNNGNYMARTEKYKLLYCQKAKSQFFDLTKDEYEMNNLIDNPEYQEEIQNLKARFVKWLAFEARSRPHVDEHGPIIHGENVPPLDGDHRNIIKDYLEKKMEEKRTLSHN